MFYYLFMLLVMACLHWIVGIDLGMVAVCFIVTSIGSKMAIIDAASVVSHK